MKSVTLAAAPGFPAEGIGTLETGCEIGFHFVDITTVRAGLNGYIHTLKKQQARKGGAWQSREK